MSFETPLERGCYVKHFPILRDIPRLFSRRDRERLLDSPQTAEMYWESNDP